MGRRSYHGWFRRPRTTQEKRWYAPYAKYTRAGRSPKNLPDVYDDILRGDIRTRKNWKNKRKRKQWM